MRLMFFGPLVLGGIVVLPGCAKKEVAAPLQQPALTSRLQSFNCKEYPGREHYVKQCTVDFQVEVSGYTEPQSVDCYGEVRFTQVYEGRVLNPPQGFFQRISLGQLSAPKRFSVSVFINFPQEYEVLDPSLSWYECNVHM